MRGIAMKIYFSNYVSVGKGDFWNLMFSFIFFSHYYWINVLYYIVFLINPDAIFTFYNGDIDYIQFGSLLKYIVKEAIKFLS